MSCLHHLLTNTTYPFAINGEVCCDVSSNPIGIGLCQSTLFHKTCWPCETNEMVR
jgi:hypothetical protein